MKFKAIKTNNGWFKLYNTEAVMQFLSGLKENDLEIVIDCRKEPRNLSQNALLHVMFSELDKVIGNNDPTMTKWQVLIHVGFYKEFDVNGQIEKYPLPTSKLNKKDFAELVTKVNHFAWEFYQLDLTSINQRGY